MLQFKIRLTELTESSWNWMLWDVARGRPAQEGVRPSIDAAVGAALQAQEQWVARAKNDLAQNTNCEHLHRSTIPTVGKGESYTPQWHWCEDCGALGILKKLLERVGRPFDNTGDDPYHWDNPKNWRP